MRSRLTVVALALSLTAGVATASATPTQPCTLGDAREQFETFPLTFEGIPACQYRLFFNGLTLTFGTNEFFLGGTVRRQSYDPSVEGSRDEAIARLKAGVPRVWIAEVTASGTGEMVEQTVMHTAVKSGENDEFGTYVWLQNGYITRLAAGEYVTVAHLADGRVTSNRLVITAAP